MQLNVVEKLLINNPLRAAVQRHLEVPLLQRMGGSVATGKVLELGCGPGVSTEMILERFGVDHVDAFDLDPDLVRQARRRLKRFGARVNLAAGDATDIVADPETYDAVFDFGSIHQIQEWREALAEIYRVLRPGGRLFAQEALSKFIRHPIWRHVLNNPGTDRFNRGQLCTALEDVGFDVLDANELWGQFTWVIARRPG